MNVIDINFSETDMNYIDSFYPSEIAENLLKLSGSEEDSKEYLEGLEEALYQLKAIAQNPYNMNYYRMLVHCLWLINDRCNCGDFDSED